MGFYLSFSGILTYRSANEIREAARLAPADRILTETDAPLLAPAPVRGKRNEPAFVLHTALKLAEIRGRLSDAQIAAVLAAGGFTEARLRAWIRDDLRIASYLDQRFAATADLSLEQAAPELRERLSAERRASLIADWVADLRRRTPIVELWKR